MTFATIGILDMEEMAGNENDVYVKSLPPPMPITQAVNPFKILTINVSGLRFQTCAETLARLPNSLLGDVSRRQKHFNPATGEFFFDRHRGIFDSILRIYQTGGHIKRPEHVSMPQFVRELKFFDMGEEVLDRFYAGEGYQKPIEAPLPANRCLRAVWRLFECPDSSPLARAVAFFSLFVIILSIGCFCVETLPQFRRRFDAGGDGGQLDWSNPFFLVEVFCIGWFSVELAARFVSSPSKTQFARGVLNIIDLVAIVPFFFNLFLKDSASGVSSMQFAVLRVLRLVRVFRIFKLSRHSVGLQILGKTFRASVREFVLVAFFMAIALVLFSSGIYFAESAVAGSDFDSIPSAFWYSLVTMTTVGYGDLVPRGMYGRLVGALCALVGVITLALPVPIIVGNFNHFYRQEMGLASMRATEEFQEEEEI